MFAIAWLVEFNFIYIYYFVNTKIYFQNKGNYKAISKKILLWNRYIHILFSIFFMFAIFIFLLIVFLWIQFMSES